MRSKGQGVLSPWGQGGTQTPPPLPRLPRNNAIRSSESFLLALLQWSPPLQTRPPMRPRPLDTLLQTVTALWRPDPWRHITAHTQLITPKDFPLGKAWVRGVGPRQGRVRTLLEAKPTPVTHPRQVMSPTAVTQARFLHTTVQVIPVPRKPRPPVIRLRPSAVRPRPLVSATPPGVLGRSMGG